MIDRLPPRVLSWYGDDFTGSTDVLEMLSLNGLPAVLFLAEPPPHLFLRFAAFRAFGLAGSSRSRTPDWMDQHLPDVFNWLASLGAPLCHYKVCSTFDSSPQIGNIGRALEIGRRTVASSWVPIVAGAPALGRYTAFGHLFAAAAGTVHRIDRHPTMSCHPVTPMHEADLRLHLAQQTSARIALMSFVDLAAPSPQSLIDTLSTADAVLFDVLDAPTLTAAGRLIWAATHQHQLFAVGSSGLEHALAAAWKADALFDLPPAIAQLQPADCLLVLSGSCSPVTASQIAFALQNGFTPVPLNAMPLATGEGRDAAMESAITAAASALHRNQSVVIYSASGPADILPRELFSQPGFRDALASMSGRILASVLDRTSVRRVVLAGGDTSSHAGALLDIEALTFLCPLAPGAPLCRAWSSNPRRDGLEIVFKGGQCGRPEFFLQVLGANQS